ncbi:hypothetical protein ILYODFUR_038701, partial [Ilyodon furcidens]
LHHLLQPSLRSLLRFKLQFPLRFSLTLRHLFSIVFSSPPVSAFPSSSHHSNLHYLSFLYLASTPVSILLITYSSRSHCFTIHLPCIQAHQFHLFPLASSCQIPVRFLSDSYDSPTLHYSKFPVNIVP